MSGIIETNRMDEKLFSRKIVLKWKSVGILVVVHKIDGRK